MFRHLRALTSGNLQYSGQNRQGHPVQRKSAEMRLKSTDFRQIYSCGGKHGNYSKSERILAPIAAEPADFTQCPCLCQARFFSFSSVYMTLPRRSHEGQAECARFGAMVEKAATPGPTASRGH